jgi:RNA polymerase sigma-70 factor (ECF subfamily)
MSNSDARTRLSDWFHQWRSPLRKFLRHSGVPRTTDIDDVAQEVFLRLLRYDRTELIENPQAYLYKMAAHVAAEWAIRARNVQPHESKWLATLVAPDYPEREAGRRELQDEIERALLLLPARHREILKLHCFENLSRAEIAARLGTSERAVKRVVMKTYEQLRLRLDPELLGGLADGSE